LQKKAPTLKIQNLSMIHIFHTACWC